MCVCVCVCVCVYIYLYIHLYKLVGRGPRSSTGCVRGTAQSDPREEAYGRGAAEAARVAPLRAQRNVAEGRRAAEAAREPPVLGGGKTCAHQRARVSSIYVDIY